MLTPTPDPNPAMLTDGDVERAAHELAVYCQTDTLPQLLEKYATLIAHYRRLKSDYEEERDGREHYKQLVRGANRNPFVLVLVDADGYVFADEFLKNRDGGGSDAAGRLLAAVKESLQAKGLEHCEIVVRLYANIAGLSKALARAGITGGEARSLGPFIADFNRCHGLCEIVDAGTLKENADFKIRAMLRLHADSPQCRHVYFAACHDVGYVSELMPYAGARDRFTLVKNTGGTGFHEEFTRLNLGVEEFPGVWRGAPLDRAGVKEAVGVSTPEAKTYSGALQRFPVPTIPGKKGDAVAAQMATPKSPIKQTIKAASETYIPVSRSSSSSSGSNSNNNNSSSNNNNKTVPCQFYPKGICRNGSDCRYSHDPPRNGGATTATTWRPAKQQPHLTTAEDIASLPIPAAIPAGTIPVNAARHRLDPQLPADAADAAKKVAARRTRVCNAFHLAGSCAKGAACEYDHDPLSASMLLGLEWLARSLPCGRKGDCRVLGCASGHVCQNATCKHRGGVAFCRLGFQAHIEDMEVKEFVDGFARGGKWEDDDGGSLL